ncbi:hypothetical protein JCGZ_07379 [Jatropha curcas]|uniref:RING-type domain-containing protein n=1 Tax=Jatropha curcas TaxID=180498 RepID=A0A067KFQ2_JATCU|nr:hypothetical protein JCGZ_07379 [Jatropha curcas]
MDEALPLPPNCGHQVSVSESLIADIPTVSTAHDTCSICMECFESGRAGNRVPCGPVYHAAWISSWLSNCNSCPLCRRNISG